MISKRPLHEEKGFLTSVTKYFAVAVITLLISGCGGGKIDGDAEKVANIMCKSQELRKKARNNEMWIYKKQWSISQKQTRS